MRLNHPTPKTLSIPFLRFFISFLCTAAYHVLTNNTCVWDCGMYVTNIIFDGILEMSNLRSLLKALLHVDDDDDD